LSNKERKRRIKEKEAAARMAEYEATAAKNSAEGAQFACSQTAINEKDPQWMNSLDINIPSFTISAAGKILFKDASFNVAHGRRYGLVGPNGRGKSTLLKMIASGDLVLPPRVDFLYVEQEVVADNTPAVDAVLKADKKRWSLQQEERVLSAAIDSGDEDQKKLDRLQEVYDELNAMNSDAAEAKARRILYGLGFDVEMQTKPTKMFSGGWRMRISLARALFIEPTLLMLDEPTNHLDLNAVIWLEDYLTRWKKTLFVVSHDQDFLNSVCGEMLHIEELKLVSYKGDYDQFKKEQATRLKQQQKAYEKQEKRLRELKRSGKSKAKATEQVKRSSKREPGARSQKKKNDAIASGTAAAEATELIARPKEYSVKLEFAEVAELSRPVMEVTNVHFRYSEKNPVIFDRIDFGIDMDSRICVVGPNGAGKSTLLKLLTGEIKATKGDVRRNPRLRMGIYNQHFVDRLPMDKTPVEHLRDRFQEEDYQSVRNRLGKYGLEGHAHEVVMRDLSGGQKARVVFVELSLQRPHILLLDEPTNNLDIETIDALIEAVNQFNGGIVVVTHDQRLIEFCECDLWVVEKESVTKWVAGFDDYKSTLLQEMEDKIAKENAVRQQKLKAAADARAEKLARLTSRIKK
jgi:ATP-binding cassette subfamily F protein 1